MRKVDIREVEQPVAPTRQLYCLGLAFEVVAEFHHHGDQNQRSDRQKDSRKHKTKAHWISVPPAPTFEIHASVGLERAVTFFVGRRPKSIVFLVYYRFELIQSETSLKNEKDEPPRPHCLPLLNYYSRV